MKPFEIAMPETLEEAVSALPDTDERLARERVQLYAGGQDLFGELKDHLTGPEVLVRLAGVPGLDALERKPDGTLVLGALVTVATIEHDDWIRANLPILSEAAAAVASPQIRSVATLGGNLCQRPRCLYYRNERAVCLKKGGQECFSYGGHNKFNAILGGGPSYIVHPSDLAPALVACDARVTLFGPEGERTLPLEEFFTLPAESDVTRENVLAPNEIVTRVEVPPKPGWRTTYLKIRERDAFDFALSAVALALRMDGDTIAEARLTLGGVAPAPWRCRSTEELMVGKTLGAELEKAAGDDALRLAEPLEHNAYKIPMTQGAITKALRSLA